MNQGARDRLVSERVKVGNKFCFPSEFIIEFDEIYLIDFNVRQFLSLSLSVTLYKLSIDVHFTRLDFKCFSPSGFGSNTSFNSSPTSYKSSSSRCSIHNLFNHNYYPTLNFTFILIMKVILILSLFTLCFALGSCKKSTVCIDN